MTLFVGVDVGTTRTKAVVLDADTHRVVAGAAVPTPQETDDGVPVHVPAKVRAAAVGAAATALAELSPARREDVGGLAVTSVAEEAVLLDAESRPVGPVPTWFSSVGNPFAAQLSDALDDRAPIAGLRHPEYTIHVLAWWVRHRARQAEEAVTLTDLGSWLLSSLGPSDLVMDHSHASRTGMFDAPTREWRPAALDVVGATHLSLPRLVPSGTVVGRLGTEAGAELGLSPGIPLVSGAHDHFCGALAAGARSPGDLFISAGTSEAHVLLTDALDREAVAGAEVGCFVTDGLFYVHAAIPSGALFQTWTRLLGIPPDQPLDDLIGAEPVGSRGVRAEIAPDRRLTLAHVPVDATAATVMRALMETTAVASRRLTRDLSTSAGRSARHRLVAGTPTASAAWREIRTAVGEVPAVFVDDAEATALGAAQLAARAVTGVLPPPVARRAADPQIAASRQREYDVQLGL